MDEPDTYSGAKYVSRVNKVAQPHPSGGDLYGLPRAVDPMLLRALQQRQNQSPQRFFKDGTHGQDFKPTYGEGELESDFHPHMMGVLNRDVDEERKRHQEDETHFWDEVDKDIDARTSARQKAERQGETVSGTETPKFDVEGSGSFFEEGTHGQAFVRGTLGQVGARPAANDQNWGLIRMGMDARDQERKEQERSEGSRGHFDAGHT